MPYDAPYYGGTAPGGRIFVVDGDFTVAAPSSAPEISTPFMGDSIPSFRDIVLLNSSYYFQNVPAGSGYNIQPFSANQTAIIVEQEFMVAQSYYRPLPLNTYYDPSWSIGWGGDYAYLGNALLVEESPLENVGGGIVKFKRKFATMPPNRNDFESYVAFFPGFTDGTTTSNSKNITVSSRIQSDFFLMSSAGVQFIPIFPEMRYYKPNASNAAAVLNNLQIDPDEPLSDADLDDPSSDPTNPSYTQWINWKQGIGCTGGLSPEIVAEASNLSRWMGNIYVHKTRFVILQ